MSISILVLASGGLFVGFAVLCLCDASVRAAWRVGMRRARMRAAAKKKGLGVRDEYLHTVRKLVGNAKAFVLGKGNCREKADKQGRCLDELPELIDVVALGLSAGVSFDAALEIYCARYSTMLADLMGNAMRSWRLGMRTRRAALRDVAQQLQVPALTVFVETVVESLDFGAPLAKTLTEQAEAVRDARRMAVEEQIEKAPVKMLIPMGALVLPALILSILGPILSSFALLA